MEIISRENWFFGARKTDASDNGGRERQGRVYICNNDIVLTPSKDYELYASRFSVFFIFFFLSFCNTYGICIENSCCFKFVRTCKINTFVMLFIHLVRAIYAKWRETERMNIYVKTIRLILLVVLN